MAKKVVVRERRPWWHSLIAAVLLLLALWVLILMLSGTFQAWRTATAGPAPVSAAPKSPSQADGPVGGLPSCPYTNGGAQTPLNDPAKVGHVSWLVFHEGDLWEIDLRKASGCNLVFEGRIVPGEKLHRVIVLRSQNGENSQYVKDGKFVYAEGSIWELPLAENVEDLANQADPADSMKLVNDKRKVMDAAGYDWPIVVSFTDGSEMTFGPGEKWSGLTEQNHCAFLAPVKINVHGEKLSGSNQFAAAIGATGCTTVAWIDGAGTPIQWIGQRDAAEKVVFTTIDAWLMPSAWSRTQIDSWASAH